MAEIVLPAPEFVKLKRGDLADGGTEAIAQIKIFVIGGVLAMGEAVAGSVFVNAFAVPGSAGHDFGLEEGVQDERVAKSAEAAPAGAAGRINCNRFGEVI